MKNWKTTLVGIIGGVGYLFLSSLTTGVKPKDAAIGAVVATLGALAKDYNVTGGSVRQ